MSDVQNMSPNARRMSREFVVAKIARRSPTYVRANREEAEVYT